MLVSIISGKLALVSEDRQFPTAFSDSTKTFRELKPGVPGSFFIKKKVNCRLDITEIMLKNNEIMLKTAQNDPEMPMAFEK